jgi:hypothetical protein
MSDQFNRSPRVTGGKYINFLDRGKQLLKRLCENCKENTFCQ